MNDAQVQQRLNDITALTSNVGTSLSKGFTEVGELIQQLKDQVSQGSVTSPETDAMFDSLEQKLTGMRDVAQQLDDLTPDAPAGDGTTPPDTGATPTT